MRASASGSRRPMSTSRICPLRSAPAPTTRPAFSAPKVTVTSAHTAAPPTAPVSASTPEGRSTATVGIWRAASASSAAAPRRPPGPPIPTIPSITSSAPSRGAGSGPSVVPAGADEVGQPLRVRAAGIQQRPVPVPRDEPVRHRRTARRRRCCPRRRAARRRRRIRGRAFAAHCTARAFAARCINAPSGNRASNAFSAARICATEWTARISRCLRRSRRLTRCRRRATCDTCQRVTPRSAARAATVPCTSRLGRPESSTTTSASVHNIPPPAPSAFASASLAAKRAASDSALRSTPAEVVSSAGMNSRAAQCRRASERLGEPLDRHHIDARRRRSLGRRRRRVTRSVSWSHRAARSRKGDRGTPTRAG